MRCAQIYLMVILPVGHLMLLRTVGIRTLKQRLINVKVGTIALQLTTLTMTVLAVQIREILGVLCLRKRNGVYEKWLVCTKTRIVYVT